MLRVGPVEVGEAVMGDSVAGPRASDCLRVMAGVGVGCGGCCWESVGVWVVDVDGGAGVAILLLSVGCAMECVGST